jgi:cytochrome P450
MTAPAYPVDRRCPFTPPAEFRQRAPFRVRIWDGSRPWLITRYDDVRAALRDPRVSSDGDRPGYPHISAGAVAQQSRVKTFMDLDDPEHAAQRRLLTAEFTFRRTAALRPRVQRIADSLTDDLLAGPNPADLVTAFSLPLPSLVICDLLGVPYADHEMFQRLSKEITSRRSTPERATAATEELVAYLAALVGEKRRRPVDDLLSRVARQANLPDQEIASMAMVLLVAGHETTANMISVGVALLTQETRRFDEIGQHPDPDFTADAVEELLRYLGIVQSGRRRVALEDLRIGDQEIARGEGIIAATDLANRDGSAFPDPDRLDFRREARHHLAFGHGIHQCLGQTLARVQLQVAYRTLARRLPRLAPLHPVKELQFVHDSVIYGLEELWVGW